MFFLAADVFAAAGPVDAVALTDKLSTAPEHH
jgi:hypothetical protein